MENKRVDRRIQRTRRALHEALVALIQEKGYEAVTVQAILDRADVGRSTFYAHFRDKEALLLSGFENLRSAFEQHRREQRLTSDATAESPWEISWVWFQHAQNHRELYRALIGRRAGDAVAKYVHGYLSVLMRDYTYLKPSAEKSRAAKLELAVNWTVSSLLALTTWWLDHDELYTAEQINETFKQLTRPGLENFWQRPLP